MNLFYVVWVLMCSDRVCGFLHLMCIIELHIKGKHNLHRKCRLQRALWGTTNTNMVVGRRWGSSIEMSRAARRCTPCWSRKAQSTRSTREARRGALGASSGAFQSLCWIAPWAWTPLSTSPGFSRAPRLQATSNPYMLSTVSTSGELSYLGREWKINTWSDTKRLALRTFVWILRPCW